MAEPNNIHRNIVVFGQTGAGKSSVINLLAGGTELAIVSGGANGCTTSNVRHPITLGNNKVYAFWDTAGLNEAEDGSVSSQVAVQNLLDLVRDNGVNLLIYCIRGRLVDITRVNYDLFWRIICKKEVPILLVVTGQEGANDMDEWWSDPENQNAIKRMKMSFDGHACITSWKGRKNMYEKQYKESGKKLWESVLRHCEENPWRMTPQMHAQAQKKVDAYMVSYYNGGSGMGRFLQGLKRILLRL